MKLNIGKYSLTFSILIIALLSVHLLLYRSFGQALGVDIKQIVEIYTFLGMLNFAHFLGLRWLFFKWAKYAGLIFTAMSLLKMAISVVFLWPYIFSATNQSVALVINFMILYFVTLGYEVVFIVKNMMKVM